jgi:hypothetical protein
MKDAKDLKRNKTREYLMSIPETDPLCYSPRVALPSPSPGKHIPHEDKIMYAAYIHEQQKFSQRNHLVANDIGLLTYKEGKYQMCEQTRFLIFIYQIK